MRTVLYITILGILLAVTACRGNTESGPKLAEPVYFDLEGLVRSDIRNLRAHGCGLLKTAVIDGKSETRQMDTVDLDEELLPLIEADINKAAWKDKFRADTLEMNGARILRYTSNSDKINIRMLEVTLDGETVKQVRLEKAIRTFAFGYTAQIDYFPGKGYRINSEQKALLIPKFVMQVKADFTCK